ncbi:hypothetical protein [Mycobacterium haemophilum]|nr:hypothetical protein [Mycobacterium haemophilum]
MRTTLQIDDDVLEGARNIDGFRRAFGRCGDPAAHGAQGITRGGR